MNELLLRRRALTGAVNTGPKYAVDRKTNAPLMDICYAQGWAANEDYMTFEEAAKPITISGNLFKNWTGESLYELGYFTALTLTTPNFSAVNWRVARLYPVNTLNGGIWIGGTTTTVSKNRLVDFGVNIAITKGWTFDRIGYNSILVFRKNTLSVPPSWDFDSANSGKYGLLTIYVPDNLVQDYESSSWGQYGNTIKPLSEYNEAEAIKQILEQ